VECHETELAAQLQDLFHARLSQEVGQVHDDDLWR
jgi:hypothetical protein